MSSSSMGIPPVIEQQLLLLDKQLRDAVFIRGSIRLVTSVCLLLAGCLWIDSWLDLNGYARGVALLGWLLVSGFILWRGILRPTMQPVSFAALAALVEKQHPELRERLTSLVELRRGDGEELAPGASTLMQDLLARQTLKAFDRVDIEHAVTERSSLRSAAIAGAALLFLLAPFGWNADNYGLLWCRFFAPWANFGWGAVNVRVVEGDQIVPRGADVSIHVALINRRTGQEVRHRPDQSVWLNWNDEAGEGEHRRLEWDEQSQNYVGMIPGVRSSFVYHAETRTAKSGQFRVDVSDPPAVTQVRLEIEPPAYTGLPARTLTAVPGEVQVPESSRIRLSIDFDSAVAHAELKWPVPADEVPRGGLREQRAGVEQSIPLTMSADQQSGTAQVSCKVSGSFAIQTRNPQGLENHDPSRMVTVIYDQPPEIRLEGSDEPILVRPEDLVEIPAEVSDDYGLTAVELHTETSLGEERIQSLPLEQLADTHVSAAFRLDLNQYGLSGGQGISYRIRAVDNRPDPQPHEVWSPPRTLVVNTTLRQLPDRELAAAERRTEEELTSLRKELNDRKAEMSDLHQQMEKDAVQNAPGRDQSERLQEMQDAQERLIARLEQLSDRLANREITKELAPKAQEIAESDLQQVRDQLSQLKDQPPRDQLEPLAQAIDKLGAADRQLRQLEQQLDDLHRLEQDLAELNRMAQRAEQLAEQLDRLAAQQDGKNTSPQTAGDSKPQNEVSKNVVPKNEPPQTELPSATAEPKSDNAAETATAQTAESPERNADQIPQKLKDQAAKLTQQMNELLQRHPELVEAARKEQVEQLQDLAELASQLAGPQERLAEALQEAANAAPNAPPPKDPQLADGKSAKAPASPESVPDGQKPTTPETSPPSPDNKTSAQESPDAPPSTAPAQQPTGTPPAKDEASTSKPVSGNSSDKPDSPDNTNPANPAGRAEPQQDGPESVPKSKSPDAAAPSEPAKTPNTAANNPPGDASKPAATETSEPDKPSAPAVAENPAATADQPANPASQPPSPQPNAPASNQDSTTPKKDVQNPGESPSSTATPPSKDAAESNSQETPPNGDAPPSQNPAAAGNQPKSPDAPPAKENPPAGDPQTPPNATPNAAPGSPPSAPGSTASEPAAKKSPEQQAGGKLVDQQQQLTNQATQQAMELARETGADSPATKSAAEFARQADAARQEAQTGQLANAAQQARQAAESARETARQLNPDGQSPSPQSQQAQQLADQQQSLAEQMQQKSSSPDAQKGAQAQGQQRLAEATKQLAQQMDRAAQTLKSNPLNSPKDAAAGEQASQAAKQAEQSMKESANAAQQNDPQAAAKSASEAAQQLKQAAQAIPSQSQSKPNSPPVPKKMGSQMTDVTKQLQQAQKNLSQCQCSGNPDGTPTSMPGSVSSSSSGKPGSPGSSGTPSAKSTASGAASPNSTAAGGAKPGTAPSSAKAPGDSPADQAQNASQNPGAKASSPQAQNASAPGKGTPQPGTASAEAAKDQANAGTKSGAPAPAGKESSAAKDGDGKSSAGTPPATGTSPAAGSQTPASNAAAGNSPQESGSGQAATKDPSSTALGQSAITGKSDEQNSPNSPTAESNAAGRNPGNGTSQPNLNSVADQFRAVAEMMRKARAGLNADQPPRATARAAPQNRSAPGQPNSQAQSGESGSDASGTTDTPDLSHLDLELQRMAKQNWGRLPGQLRTEILQGAGKKSHPEYTQRIKSYFDEITKSSK